MSVGYLEESQLQLSPVLLKSEDVTVRNFHCLIILRVAVNKDFERHPVTLRQAYNSAHSSDVIWLRLCHHKVTDAFSIHRSLLVCVFYEVVELLVNLND